MWNSAPSPDDLSNDESPNVFTPLLPGADSKDTPPPPINDTPPPPNQFPPPPPSKSPPPLPPPPPSPSDHTSTSPPVSSPELKPPPPPPKASPPPPLPPPPPPPPSPESSNPTPPSVSPPTNKVNTPPPPVSPSPSNHSIPLSPPTFPPPASISPPVIPSTPPPPPPPPPTPLSPIQPSLSPPVLPLTPEIPTGTPPLNIPPPSPSRPTETPPRHAPPAKSSPTSGDSSSASTSEKGGSSHSAPPNSLSTQLISSSSTAMIGLAIFGGIILAIVLLCCLKKKRRKMDDDLYHVPPSLSVKSDGFFKQGNSFGLPLQSGSYHAMSSNHGQAHDSLRGHPVYHQGPPDPGAKSCFSYEELMEITDGFSRDNLIGEGGFGCVYKGVLPDGRKVAIKQLKAGSGQGEREFRAEVEIISRVHHRHLVSLVGYCIVEYHRLLVYEFVPNNTLEHHLHGREAHSMDWPKRLKIAIGSSRGLAYLHEDCHPRIIHRDIKSANILLDNSWEAQVADFGLAKPSNDTHTHVSTRIMGTFGYMAPEYASSGKLTDRSDVFSFGVVLLEIITGRKPVDPSQPLGDESLVEWARPLLVHALETGDFEPLVDPRLENNFDRGEVLRMIEVAAACVRHSAPKRPRMVQVLRALDNEGGMTDLSNGVKFGQSTVFDSGQYSADIRNFRRMALGSDEFSGESGYSGEREMRKSPYGGQHDGMGFRQSADYRNRGPGQSGEYEGRGQFHSGEHEYSGNAYSGEYTRRGSPHGGEPYNPVAPPRPPSSWRPGENNFEDPGGRGTSQRCGDGGPLPRPPGRLMSETASSGEYSNESETHSMFPRRNDRSDGTYRSNAHGFT